MSGDMRRSSCAKENLQIVSLDGMEYPPVILEPTDAEHTFTMQEQGGSNETARFELDESLAMSGDCGCAMNTPLKQILKYESIDSFSVHPLAPCGRGGRG